MATIKWRSEQWECSEIELGPETIASKFEFVGAGAQGAVYKWRSTCGTFAVKVLADHNIFQRIEEIDRRLKGAPASARRRGIPVAYGVGKPAEFGLKSTRLTALLIFNFIEGEQLIDALKDEDIFSKKRRNYARQLLEIFEVLETSGVIHTDAYEDNFFVEGGSLYASDLEGAGIWNIRKNRWLYKPLVAGKTQIFSAPPELDANKEPHPRSMTWYGLRLIHKTLLRYEPYDFFRAYSTSFMREKWEDCLKRHNINTWPPSLDSPESCKLDPERLGVVQETYKQYIPESEEWGRAFRHFMFRTFGAGYSQPGQRPSMREIFYYLRGAL